MAHIEPIAYSIEPGRAIGSLQLGQSEDNALKLMPSDHRREDRNGVTVFLHADVSIFTEDGVVTQIGIHGGHTAAGPGGLRLGASLAELGNLHDQLELDVYDAVLLLAEHPGLCFQVSHPGLDLEAFDNEDSAHLPDAAIVDWIGVFPPEPVEERNPRIPVVLLPTPAAPG